MIRSARQIVNEDLRPLNLSSAEGNILFHLLIQNQELGQEQLTEQMDISKAAISRALAALEAKGFVTRHPDLSDGRARLIRLTERAWEIGPAVEQAYNQLYAFAMQDISQEELEQFVNLFARISGNFSHVHEKKG